MTQQRVSLKENRSPFSTRNKLARLAWSVAAIAFKATPSWALNGFRLFILRRFGATIGQGCIVYPSARIWAPWNLSMGDNSCIGPDSDIYSMARVRIGDNVTVSQHAVLCTGTHDVSSRHAELLTRELVVESESWICAYAKVLPGVKVAQGSVIGMGAVLTRSTQPWSIYAGNPAKFIKDRVIGQ